ncbi:MAG: exodeoxyribonuclease VII small subunit [Prevotella sp.]|nr:exodeoxyribonuclease VII small subunit [Prevotella sp.]
MDAIKYEEAVQELESIVKKMENEQLDIDSLSTYLKRAQQLIKFCTERLNTTDAEIKKIMEEQ